MLLVRLLLGEIGIGRASLKPAQADQMPCAVETIGGETVPYDWKGGATYEAHGLCINVIYHFYKIMVR